MIIDQAEKILQKQQLEERNLYGFCAGDRVQITVEIDHGKEGFVKKGTSSVVYEIKNQNEVHCLFPKEGGGTYVGIVPSSRYIIRVEDKWSL